MLEKTIKTLDLQRQVIALFQKDLSSIEPQTFKVPEVFTLLETLYRESIAEIKGLESLSNGCIPLNDKRPQ